MSMLDCIRGASRERLMQGEMPAWIANSKRRRYVAAVVLSAPPWVDRAALRAIQAHARALTVETGISHEVSHITPLNHPMVCGLTVPWNLVVLPAAVNRAMTNHFLPGQLELFE